MTFPHISKLKIRTSEGAEQGMGNVVDAVDVDEQNLQLRKWRSELLKHTARLHLVMHSLVRLLLSAAQPSDSSSLSSNNHTYFHSRMLACLQKMHPPLTSLR
jgi:hypothetical protein